MGLVSAPVFLTMAVLAMVPARPDASVPASLGPWVELTRIYVDRSLGPITVSAPRLVDARCLADGSEAALTFEAAVGGERSTFLLQFAPEAGGDYEVLAVAPVVDPAYQPEFCGAVSPTMPFPTP
jgi:hypothetical protein